MRCSCRESFPHVTGIYTSMLEALADCLFSHLVHARMLSPTSTSLPALCHVVAMGKACCTTFCKQLLNVSKTRTGSVGTSAGGSSSQPLKLPFSSAFGRSSGVLQENLHVLLPIQLLMATGCFTLQVIVDYMINFRQTAWAALWRCKWTGTPASGRCLLLLPGWICL